MAMAMWARTAAGTNLAFVKGIGKALKSWKEILQQTVVRKVAPRPKTFDVSHAKERCLNQPVYQLHPTEKLQSRVFRSLFSRSTNMTLASALRRRAANELLSSGGNGARNFRRVPILSLIGVTLGLDVGDLIKGNSEKVMSEMREMFQDYGWQAEPLAKAPNSLEDLEINHSSIAAGCEGAVYKAKVKTSSEDEVQRASDEDFDLAVKAVFNYGAESSAAHILRELHREMVPLNSKTSDAVQCCGELSAKGRLPAHPNIVDMPGIFVDDVLVTEEGLKNFPAAMPHKLNPEQFYGRNKTLYLVMRRRSTHLRDYLSSHQVPMKTRCLILAQVLEGVSHLVKHGIAHRDLKTDNILVDVPKSGDVPKVEICDFGCCLAEDDRSLLVSYPSRDLYLGGNSWLMAPEIATAVPGPNKVLDFSKSDVWAVGAIAHEILGAENPFYPSKDNSRRQLSSRNYCHDDLPSLPDEVPDPVRKLVKSLLCRDPKKRPSASVAASVVHMAVMEIDKCLVSSNPLPARSKVPKRATNKQPQLVQAAKEREMLQAVLVQSLTLLCRLTFGAGKVSWDVESVSRFLFLSRLHYQDFRSALHFF